MHLGKNSVQRATPSGDPSRYWALSHLCLSVTFSRRSKHSEITFFQVPFPIFQELLVFCLHAEWASGYGQGGLLHCLEPAPQQGVELPAHGGRSGASGSSFGD